ncbi:hypothetical protein SK128_026314 [Halocaridina rubra]|uniref:VWFC domain-containing protein n=1 Tax=Halocaridina rubra TaxID=373956 RepID=A0AAN8WH62_HALRR
MHCMTIKADGISCVAVDKAITLVTATPSSLDRNNDRSTGPTRSLASAKVTKGRRQRVASAGTFMRCKLLPFPSHSQVLPGYLSQVPHNLSPFSAEDFFQQKQTDLSTLFHSTKGGMIGPLFKQDMPHNWDSQSDGGCFYQFQHYDEGDRIITNEPCLNCTCHNSMLMCYLKVCPFSKPIGQDCTIEKRPDQCCPVITCPQVPVNLQVMQMMTTTSTPKPIIASTALEMFTEHGCTIEGQYYPDGAQVPGVPNKPCELCYCIRNHTACVMQECILKVNGCDPVFSDGICCPVRYKCAYEEGEDGVNAITEGPGQITGNGSADLLTTTMIPGPIGCMHNGLFYADGASIPSADPCEHCYCMKSDLVCAIQECGSPLDEMSENCTPRTPAPGQCCPEAYDCPERPEITTGTTDHISLTMKNVTDIYIDEIGDTTATPDSTEEEFLIPSTTSATITETSSQTSPSDSSTDSGIQTEVSNLVSDSLIDTTVEDKPVTTLEGVVTFTAATDEPVGDLVPEIEEPTTDKEPVESYPTTNTGNVTVKPDGVEDLPSNFTDLGAHTVPVSSSEESTTKLTSSEAYETTTQDPSEGKVTLVSSDKGGAFSTRVTGSELPSTDELTYDTTTDSTVTESTYTFVVPSGTQKEATKESAGVVTDPTTENSTDAVSVSDEQTTVSTDSVVETAEDSTTYAPNTDGNNTDSVIPVDSASVDMTDVVTDIDGEVTGSPISTDSTTEESRDPDPGFSMKVTDSPIPVDSTTKDTTDNVTEEAPEDLSDSVSDSVENVTDSSISVAPVTEESTSAVSEIDENVTDSSISTDITAASVTDFPESTISVHTTTEVSTADISSTYEEIAESTTPVDAITEEITTEDSAFEDESCLVNDNQYENNSLVPTTSPCQESCKCLNGNVSCELLACSPPPPAFLRCTSETSEDACCPSYNCPPTDPVSTQSPNCIRDEIQYAEGDYVPSSDLCSDCYCIEGEIICAILECLPPVGENCRPVDERSTESCCPQKYECDQDKVNSGSQMLVTDEADTEKDESTGNDTSPNGSPTKTPEDMMTGPVSSLETRTTGTGETPILTTPMAITTEEDDTDVVTVIPTEIIVDINVDTDDNTTAYEPSVTNEPLTSGIPVDNDVSTVISEIEISTSKVDIVNETGDGIEMPVTTEDPTPNDKVTESTVGGIAIIFPDSSVTIIDTSFVTSESVTESTVGVVIDVNESITELPDPLINTDITSSVPGEGSCMYNDTTYGNEENIPSSSPCHESCFCRNSIISCTLKACPPSPPSFLRCEAVEDPDQCCPSYNCLSPNSTLECIYNGIQYPDGDFIPSPDICTDCYCIGGERICATLECQVPSGKNCTPINIREEICCPEAYECDEDDGAENQTITETTTHSAVNYTEGTTVHSEDTEGSGESDTSTVSGTDITPTETTAENGEVDLGVDGGISHLPPVTDETTTSSYSEIDITEQTTISTDDLENKSTDSETQSKETVTTVNTGSIEVDITTLDTSEPTITTEYYKEPSTVAPESELSEYETEKEFTSPNLPLSTSSPDDYGVTEISQEIDTDAPSSAYPKDEETTTIYELTTEYLSITYDDTYTPESTEISTDTPSTMSPGEESLGQTNEKSTYPTNEFENDMTTLITYTVTTPDYDDIIIDDYYDTLGLSRPENETGFSEATPDYSTEVTEEVTDISLSTDVNYIEVTSVIDFETTTISTIDGDEGDMTLVSSVQPIESVSQEGEVTETHLSAEEISTTAQTDTGGAEGQDNDSFSETTAVDSQVEFITTESVVNFEITTTDAGDTTEYIEVDEDKEEGVLLLLQNCIIQSASFADGATVPSSSPCQENCKCNNGTVLCQKASCPPAPPAFLRCSPIPPSDDCCPSYDCPSVKPNVTCSRDGDTYQDGEYVPSPNECTDCYCLFGEIICATLECVPPSDNCTPLPQDSDSCCPDKYECEYTPESMLFETGSPTPSDITESTVVTESSTMILTDENKIDVSIITEASVATDGLDASEEPMAIVTVISVEDTDEEKSSTETSLDPVIPNDGDEISNETSTVMPFTVVPAGATGDETLIFVASEASNITDEPVSSVVSSITTEPQRETTITDTVSQSTVADTELEDSGDDSAITEGKISSQPDQVTTTEHFEITSETTLYPEESSEGQSIVTVDNLKINDTASTESTLPLTVTTQYPPVSSNATDKTSVVQSTVSTDSTSTSSSLTISSEPTVTSSSLEEDEISPFPPYPGNIQSHTTTSKPESPPEFALGPGACLFDGKVYVSAQQIPRDDPCDFCFCFRGDIICLQQSCPPPIPGCYEEPIVGFCCPRYECPVTQTVMNITTTTTPIPTYPSIQHTQKVKMCEIGERFYHTGEIVDEASGPCLECRCGHDGMMECDPKDCQAEPMLRKILGTKYKR